MAEEDDKPVSKHLTAAQLLKTRGILVEAYDEFTRSSSTLPKTGDKQFEPNGSWLQQKQISRTLENRRDLIKIEKVNRLSQLACAQWLAEEKRALVTKNTGVEWNNYGTAVGTKLYLIPEEALLLLEMNCLELMWKGLPLSIQQAYELLIDSPEGVSLNEYRVYSHLARMGYRLQKYRYEKSSMEKLEEPSLPKKKVVVPENGQWIDNDEEEEQIEENSREDDEMCKQNDEESEKNGYTSEDDDVKLINVKEKSEHEVQIESIGQPSQANGHNSETNVESEKIGSKVLEISHKQELEIKPNEIDEKPTELSSRPKVEGKDEKTDRNSAQIDENSEIELKIIAADERNEILNTNDQNSLKTTENSLKINGQNSASKTSEQTSKCKSSKIEIVSEETIATPIKIIRSPAISKESSTPRWTASRIQRNVKLLPKRVDSKRRSLQGGHSSPPAKKFKEEAIDLSDDDIQEIPREQTRMELLNLLPNVAANDRIEITRERLPPNVCPQRQFYQYDRKQSEKTQGTNQCAGPSSTSAVVSCSRNSTVYGGNPSIGQANLAHQMYRANSSIPWGNPSIYHVNSHFYGNPGSNRGFFGHHPRFSPYHPWRMPLSRPIGNPFASQFNPMTGWPLNQMTIIRNSINLGCVSFGYIAAAAIQQSMRVTSTTMWNNFRGRRPDTSRPPCPLLQRTPECPEEVYQSSFTKLPANSWGDLKQKWRDAKTITIDDEDEKIDCSEVEVAEEVIEPLVGPKHNNSIAEIFQRLNVIKPAQEKTVRRKKGDYKISYKIYPRDNTYKKSNPGSPLFHIVVTSNQKPFLQPIELNRLQQEDDSTSIVFAIVAGSSISFLQTGVVSLPNLEIDSQNP